MRFGDEDYEFGKNVFDVLADDNHVALVLKNKVRSHIKNSEISMCLSVREELFYLNLYGLDKRNSDYCSNFERMIFLRFCGFSLQKLSSFFLSGAGHALPAS